MSKLPKMNSFVTVVDNTTMKEVADGILIGFSMYIITININGEIYTFDSRYHHFKGYEPKDMMVKIPQNKHIIDDEYIVDELHRQLKDINAMLEVAESFDIRASLHRAKTEVLLAISRMK